MSEALENEALQAPTIREALTAAVEQVREPDEESVANTSAEAEARARDNQGRFAKPQATEKTADPVASPLAEEGALSRPARPSSWKKDYEEQWNTLDPKLADYINQREREYATGVSTYRQEAERSRHLQQAIEPFMPDLQRHGIEPAQWIRNLGTAHQMLAQGSPQQKLQLFAQLAHDYGVDVRGLINEDGSRAQPSVVDQQSQWMLQQMRQMQGELAHFKTERDQQSQQSLLSEIEKFRADTAKYPHFETVRETMAGLLQSGLAQDLSSAYDKAIRMHDDLWQSQQEAQRANAETERQRAAAEAAKAARAKVSSVKGATPSAAPQGAEATKGRREQLQEAFASAGAGRV